MEQNELKISAELYQLLKDINKLTRMKICFYDQNGIELFYYPNKVCHFCRLIRENPKVNAKCIKCDMEALQEVKKRKQPYFYTCHAGLTESLTPIIAYNKIVGFISMGQIKTPNAKITLTEKFDENLLNDYINRLPVNTIENIQAAINIVKICAEYDKIKTFMQDSSENFILKIDGYIYQNIKKIIDINDLMDYFNVSRVEIYRLFKENFDATPAKFIKNKRIEEAKNLLVTTNDPVNIVGDKVGISDYNYFTKIFKKEVGCSPTSYRKNNKHH